MTNNASDTAIGIIGLGRLGLCLALNLEKSGYSVVGVDVAPDRVVQIRSRTLSSPEPGVTEALAKAERLAVYTELQALNQPSISTIFVVVDTPSLPDGGYDHSRIAEVITGLAALDRPEQQRNLVINCTTMPGYCDTLEAQLDEMGYRLVYNPEFIAQGSIMADQVQPDQVLIGTRHPEAAQAVESIYRKLCTNTPECCTMLPLSAEIAKLATNCFLTTKISFANAIGDLARTAGAEPDKILAAVGADQRIGNAYLRYGFGYGGPCFPRDNRALMHYGAQLGQELLLSSATDKVNREHLEFQFRELQDAPEPIVFDSVTYKPGTDILEESQQLALAEKLARAGKQVVVREIPAVVQALQDRYGDLFTYEPAD
ncbi:MAG: nucleotide sugar dehydrogenase [Bacteroidota bacterium]